MRKKISDKLRWKKLKEYNYKCICCDEKDMSKLEIDHIVPLARGGGDNENNLQVLCSRCNGNKGSYQYGEYYHKERSDNPELLYNVIAGKVIEGINKNFNNPLISVIDNDRAVTIGIKKALEY